MIFLFCYVHYVFDESLISKLGVFKEKVLFELIKVDMDMFPQILSWELFDYCYDFSFCL